MDKTNIDRWLRSLATTAPSAEPDISDVVRRTEVRSVRKRGSAIAAAVAVILIGAIPLYWIGRAMVGDLAATSGPHVACDGHATAVVSAEVRATARGVQIVVENRTTEPIAVTVVGVGGSSAAVGASALPYPAGGSEWPLPPGRLLVRCATSTGGQSNAAELMVEDPDGHWRPISLSCSPRTGLTDPFLDPAFATEGSPEEIVRAFFAERSIGLGEGETLERGGYPGSSDPVFRIRRQSTVLAWAEMESPSPGRWMVGSWAACVQT